MEESPTKFMISPLPVDYSIKMTASYSTCKPIKTFVILVSFQKLIQREPFTGEAQQLPHVQRLQSSLQWLQERVPVLMWFNGRYPPLSFVSLSSFHIISKVKSQKTILGEKKVSSPLPFAKLRWCNIWHYLYTFRSKLHSNIIIVPADLNITYYIK